jgi:DNA-binding LacI/PurR family transcriptional regulator
VDTRLIEFPSVTAPRETTGARLLDLLLPEPAGAGLPGLVLFSYTLAPAFCTALAARRVRVPEDLALIVGDEDVDVSDSLDVPLTVVRAPKFEMGQAAMAALEARIGGLSLAPEQQVQRFPMWLHVRWSCGARRRWSAGDGASGAGGAGDAGQPVARNTAQSAGAVSARAH